MYCQTHTRIRNRSEVQFTLVFIYSILKVTRKKCFKMPPPSLPLSPKKLFIPSPSSYMGYNSIFFCFAPIIPLFGFSGDRRTRRDPSASPLLLHVFRDVDLRTDIPEKNRKKQSRRRRRRRDGDVRRWLP